MITITSPTGATSSKAWRATAVAILFWPIVGLFITIAAWFFLLKSLGHDRDLTQRAGYQSVAKTALSQANQIRKDLAMVDQMLLMARMHARTFSTNDQLTHFVGSLVPPGGALAINVYDVHGISVASSKGRSELKKSVPTVAREAFFSEQQRRVDDSLFIGIQVRDPSTGIELLRLSRRLVDTAGTFAGVVSVEIDAASLALDDSKAVLGSNGFLLVMKKDSTAQTLPLSEGTLPTVTMLHQLPDVRSSERGSVRWEPFGAGAPRKYFLAWHAVTNFPVVVVAAVDQAWVLSRYNERENAAIQTAAGASFAMLAFVIAAAAVTARLELQRHQLSLAQAAYRTATEQGSEGFFIAKPTRDRSEVITDYLTVDCNESGARFFSRSRDKIVGQTVSSLQALLPLDLVMTEFAKAMESGFAEFTLRITQDVRVTPTFVNATAVKTDGVLAITLRDVTLEKVHLSSLERRTKEDTLTSLPNRAWLTETLPCMVANAEQSGKILAVLFVDLDGFKCVNDTFGHAAGDELLKLVSQRLKVAVRPRDQVARIGGDEFVIVLEDLDSSHEAASVADRVLSAFRTPFAVTSGLTTVGTSIGISLYPSDASDSETLLRHADMAMYAVKTSGKNRYQHFDRALFVELLRKAQLQQDLGIAITERQFVMHYQPRVNVATGAVFSLEALVRWNHPVEGLIGPDRFIPVAEETGAILQLGEMIIDMVCEQLSVWAKCSSQIVPVSINVSSRQFNEVDIHACIAGALTRHGVNPSCVEVELTESTMVKDPAKTSACIHALHNLGIRLLVDDFGTGYSSLAMLQELDFDILKVDKSFTRRLGVDHQGEIFFGAIVTMAHALGMRVIAEGVESSQQLEILRRLQCDEVQGFYLYRPAEAGSIQAATWSTQT